MIASALCNLTNITHAGVPEHGHGVPVFGHDIPEYGHGIPGHGHGVPVTQYCKMLHNKCR